jgi:hypothetical protein
MCWPNKWEEKECFPRQNVFVLCELIEANIATSGWNLAEQHGLGVNRNWWKLLLSELQRGCEQTEPWGPTRTTVTGGEQAKRFLTGENEWSSTQKKSGNILPRRCNRKQQVWKKQGSVFQLKKQSFLILSKSPLCSVFLVILPQIVVDCFVVLCFDSTNLLGDLWIWVVSWMYTGCVSPLCRPYSLLVGMFDGPIMGIWGLDRMTVCVVFQ